ncbi:MAG: hypothetical protein ABIP03_05520, partial [Aquihabitans sp.]
MTAMSPSPVPAPGQWATRRGVVWAVVGVALVGFVIWAKGRINGLDTSTQATNPIMRWEWLFDRERTPNELRELTIEHLQLTVIPM